MGVRGDDRRGVVRPPVQFGMPAVAVAVTDRGGRWLKRDGDRWLMACGRHQGEDLDDVPESYLRWLLDEADRRPTPAEELAIRVACGEIHHGVGGRVVLDAAVEWVNVVVGRWSFQIPAAIAETFDEEMQRLLSLDNIRGEAAAFEAIVVNSVLTPLEGLE